jgi:YQGE family putative transporter
MKFPLIAMLGTFSIFSMANAFSNLFLNIYIWKQHSSLITVGWFQIFSFLFVFFGFLCGAFVIRWAGSRINFLLSSTMALGLYTFLFIGNIDSFSHIALAGLMNGMYIGLFFAGLNFYSLWFSERDNVSKIISLQYIINGAVQFITPPIAGWIIHTKGYEAAFLTAIVILLVQTLCSTATPQVKIRNPFRRKGFFVPENRNMRNVGLASASFGFFYAFVHMSISIFIYMFVQNEWTLGEWNMLFAVFSVITYFFLGKSLMRPYQETLGTLGVIISTIVTLTLFVPYPAAFIVFNAVISVSLPMMWVPSFTHHFNTIRHEVQLSSANPLTKMMQLLVFREFSLCLGRLTFLMILIFNLTFIHQGSLSVLVIFLCFMPASLFLLSKKSTYKP